MLSNCRRKASTQGAGCGGGWGEGGVSQNETCSEWLIRGAHTVSRIAPLTRLENRAPEPPGSSANTVYMMTVSTVGAETMRTGENAQSGRENRNQQTCSPRRPIHAHIVTKCIKLRKQTTHFAETAEKKAGKNPNSDMACRLWAVAATLASTEQKEASTLLMLTQVASQLPATCVASARGSQGGSADARWENQTCSAAREK